MAEPEAAATAAMEAEVQEPAAANPSLKREREEGDDSATVAAGDAAEEAAAKKQKVGGEGDEGEEKEKEKEAKGSEDEAQGKEESAKEEEGKPVKLGPKEFATSVEMFDYFFALLHSWAPQLDINKYEHMVLEDLLKKGHAESDRKIGPGVEAFEIRNHPVWQSRCFFVRRVDGSSDDFSFRKCVDNILPLPEDMKIGGKSNGKKAGGYRGGGRGGGGGGRGGGRGFRGRGRRGN